jgi:hypothetical protein
VLDEFGVHDVEDVDELQHHPVAGRRQVLNLPTVGATQRLASRHHVPSPSCSLISTVASGHARSSIP